MAGADIIDFQAAVKKRADKAEAARIHTIMQQVAPTYTFLNDDGETDVDVFTMCIDEKKVYLMLKNAQDAEDQQVYFMVIPCEGIKLSSDGYDMNLKDLKEFRNIVSELGDEDEIRKEITLNVIDQSIQELEPAPIKAKRKKKKEGEINVSK